MSDNVLLLGAGFSHEAGIPLMSGFLDTMWEIAQRGRIHGQILTLSDKTLFGQALTVREILDGYHGRANFDDRNLEDVLSLLSFAQLAKNPGNESHLSVMTRAIARTIELTCAVKHPGVSDIPDHSFHRNGPDIYRKFWWDLMQLSQQGFAFPTLITFNYDLVLERSLAQTMIGPGYFSGSLKFPNAYLRLNYHQQGVPKIYFRVNTALYPVGTGSNQQNKEGTTLKKADVLRSDSDFEIDLLKLHGSVNFPPNGGLTMGDYNFTEALDTPAIMPPIFNKFSGAEPGEAWRVALEKLRSAKNVVIIGYSLPTTDIYMQYFLKAALGPNRGIVRIVVFDPVLFETSDRSSALRGRYANCFSAQTQSRIVYKPTRDETDTPPGTLSHFLRVLEKSPSEILYSTA